MRRNLSILFLALVAFLSWWWSSRDKTFVQSTVVNQTRPADYFMEDVTSLRTGPQGQLLRQLHARRMTHYPDDDRLDLDTPFLTVYQQSGGIWTIRSQQGTVSEQGERLLMSGDVLIEQPGIENSVQIATPELLVLNTPQTAATDKPVRITRGDARTDAVGMRANLQTQYVELLAEVTSVYKPAP